MTWPLTATASTRERRAARFDVRRLPLAQVDDADDLDAGRLEVRRGAEPAIVGRDDERALGRLDRPEVDEAPRAVGEHHADEVVAREDERLLDRSRRDDHPRGADLDERVPVRDRDEAVLEEPDRDRGASSSTPASSARCRSSAAQCVTLCGRRAARRRRSGPLPRRSHGRHAPRPRSPPRARTPPPPMTTTSACSWTTSTRSPLAPFGSSFPSPATPRSTFS